MVKAALGELLESLGNTIHVESGVSLESGWSHQAGVIRLESWQCRAKLAVNRRHIGHFRARKEEKASGMTIMVLSRLASRYLRRFQIVMVGVEFLQRAPSGDIANAYDSSPQTLRCHNSCRDFLDRTPIQAILYLKCRSCRHEVGCAVLAAYLEQSTKALRIKR